MNKWIAGSVVGLCVVLAVVTHWVNPQKPVVQEVDRTVSQEVQTKLATLQIPFIQNKGQMNGEVSFYAQTFAGTMFVTKDGGMVYAIQKTEDRSQNDPASLKLRRDERGTVIKESLVGGKILEIKGEGESVTKVNSFIGNDPAKWQRNIATFGMVNLGEVYPGIGLKLKAYGKNVEKLFEVKPGASPEEIRVKLEGSKDLKVNEGGELVASTEAGDIKFTKPIAYQEIDGKRIEVEAAYNLQTLSGQVVYGFKVGSYNKNHSLVIDPLLASRVIGAAEKDEANAIAIDGNGNVYVTGRSFSVSYPTTIGAFDIEHANVSGGFGSDVFVTKLSSDLSTPLSSTFLGGVSTDEASAIAIGVGGNVYVAGVTRSVDYPVSLAGVFDSTWNGSDDVFVTKLNSNLTGLSASTYVGSSSMDVAYAMAIDTAGNIYVAGYTYSGAYPTPGGYDGSHNVSGNKDAFVSKLDSALSGLTASTFIGGEGDDQANALVVGMDGSVYVTGDTDSIDFETTGGAYVSPNKGGGDVFITKLNGNLSALLASAFFGGGDLDKSTAIAKDGSGNIYVAGTTHSSEYPTQGAYDASFNDATGAGSDVFISKLTGDLSTLLASTFIGGDNPDEATALGIDQNGDIFAVGYTSSTNYPITSGAYDSSYNGGDDDAFVSKLTSKLSSLSSSTYIGGTRGDFAKAIAFDSSGNVYVAGYAFSPDYPKTIGSNPKWKATWDDDVFISKLDASFSGPLSAPSSLTTKAISSSKIVLTWKDQSANETGFKIERRVGGCSTTGWTQIATVGASVTTHTNTGLTANTTYSYRVRAYNDNGNSSYSGCGYVTTARGGTPASPANLKATSLSLSKVSLSWGNVSNEKSYKVFRKVGTGKWALLATKSANIVSHADTTANGNGATKAYSYYIQACNGVGCSPATNVAGVPYAPSGLAANPVSSSKIDLSWTDKSSNETGFEIQRKDEGCSSTNAWANIAVLGTNVVAYQDTGHASGMTHAYRVRSYTRSYALPYAKAYSSWSNCSEAKTL